MILVDTSVLIAYFKNIDNEATLKFASVLKNSIPFGINNFIYQELLQGVSNEKDFTRLKEYLETQVFYELTNGRKSYENAAKIYYMCKKAGFTIRSTIDTLITQTAIENNLALLHDDKDFTFISGVVKELRVY